LVRLINPICEGCRSIALATVSTSKKICFDSRAKSSGVKGWLDLNLGLVAARAWLEGEASGWAWPQ